MSPLSLKKRRNTQNNRRKGNDIAQFCATSRALLDYFATTAQPIHAISRRKIITPTAVSLYRLLGVCALRAYVEDWVLMLTTTLRGFINYGSACLREPLGAMNCANGIFQNSHEVRISPLQQQRYHFWRKPKISLWQRHNITLAKREYHSHGVRNIRYDC